MSYLDLFAPIRAFVFDVDGVLTNGQVILLPDGQQMRHMHTKDGYAIQLAVKKGYHVAIISGGNSVQVKERLNALGVTDTYLGIRHKDEALDEFRHNHGLALNEIMYMGDDIPDLCALRLVGLPCCPADASTEVKELAKFISKLNGGEGCARDITERIMRSHGRWFDPAQHEGTINDFTW